MSSKSDTSSNKPKFGQTLTDLENSMAEMDALLAQLDATSKSTSDQAAEAAKITQNAEEIKISKQTKAETAGTGGGESKLVKAAKSVAVEEVQAQKSKMVHIGQCYADGRDLSPDQLAALRSESLASISSYDAMLNRPLGNLSGAPTGIIGERKLDFWQYYAENVPVLGGIAEGIGGMLGYAESKFTGETPVNWVTENFMTPLDQQYAAMDILSLGMGGGNRSAVTGFIDDVDRFLKFAIDAFPSGSSSRIGNNLGDQIGAIGIKSTNMAMEKLDARGFSGVVTNQRGGLDYSNSNALFNQDGINPIQKIEYTGVYKDDFTAANMAAFGKVTTPKDYVWHHLDDYDPISNTGTMQLVHRNAHSGITHYGGAAQYKAATGKSYIFKTW